MPINQAKHRNAEKTYKVLMFLHRYKWSHQDVLQRLLKLNSRQAIHKTLAQMQKCRLISKQVIEKEYGAPVIIWAITAHGINQCLELNEHCDKVYAFELSKFKVVQMHHRLDIQLAQIKAESAGWTNLTVSGFNKKGCQKPDLIGTRPDGKTVAFELERTQKQVSRYGKIIVSHLTARKQGFWDEIYYLMPTSNLKKRIEFVITTLDKAKYQNRIISLTVAHKEPFKFFTYDEDWDLSD
jgi:hypothetical protein